MSEVLSIYQAIPIEWKTILFFGLLFFFIMMGVPLTFVLGGLSVVFISFEFMDDPRADGLYLVASKMWDLMETSSLIAIPLYVFMAMVLERSGVAHDLYRMMHLWWGSLRGGLAIGTVLICTIFAAMSGISGAAVVTMGTIALPQMLKRGYDARLALGAINSGGGWGILIPPSILMVHLRADHRGVRSASSSPPGCIPGPAAVRPGVPLHRHPLPVAAGVGPRPAARRTQRGDWSEKTSMR